MKHDNSITHSRRLKAPRGVTPSRKSFGKKTAKTMKAVRAHDTRSLGRHGISLNAKC